MSLRSASIAGAACGALALTLAAGAGSASAGTAHPASTTSPTLTGTVIDVGSNFFTLQTAGRQVGVINALTATATRITNLNTPYVWGGGHAQAGVASVGEKGPGYNGRRAGFDCSGSVAAVLAGAGLWPAGAGVPADNGVISELMSEHLIARGVGTTPDSVTLYDDPGVHIFMNIDGRFFGTSDGDGGGDKAGGAGWLDDGAYDASNPKFKKYHFLPSVLKERTSYGNDFTFQLPDDGLFPATARNVSVSLGDLPASDLLGGERVRVSYSQAGTGAMTVQSVAVISGGPQISPVTTTPTVTTPTVTTPTVTTPTVTTPTVSTPVVSTPTVTVPGVVVVNPNIPSGNGSVSGATNSGATTGGTPVANVSGGIGLNAVSHRSRHHRHHR